MSNRRKHRTVKVRQYIRSGSTVRAVLVPITHPALGVANATVEARREATR